MVCFSFFFLFFFCKQQIAFQWHDCCSSLLLVRCVCSDKTNVHMLYTISSNTYFAFLPSNLAFIEDQRREICLKTRILAMPTTKLALFHIFCYWFWTDSTDNNHLHLYVCTYICALPFVQFLILICIWIFIYTYVNIHLYKQTFTTTLNGLQYYKNNDNQGTQKLSTTYDAVEIAAAIFFCCVRCTNTHSPICQSTKPKQQRHSENDARLWIFTPFV